MRNRAGLETRNRILTATRSLLAGRGLSVTVKDICGAAEIQVGSFYNLFGSKDEVVLSVIREAITAVDPDPSGTATETPAELVDAYVRFVQEQSDLARVYLMLLIGRGLTDTTMAHRFLRHHQQRVDRLTGALRRQGLEEGQAAHRAEVIVAALNGYAVHWMLDSSFPFAVEAAGLHGPAGEASGGEAGPLHPKGPVD